MFNIIVKEGKFILECDFGSLAGAQKTPGDNFMNIATIRGFFMSAAEEAVFHYRKEVDSKEKILVPGSGATIPLKLLH